MKLERCIGIVVAMVRQDIEERSHKIKAFSRDIGYLEDGTDPLTDELSCGFNSILAVFDKDWDFASTGRFQYSGYLSDGLLQDVWRTNINFGNDDHDWHIQGQGNTEMLSFLLSVLVY